MEGRGEWEGRVGKEGGWEQTALGRACMIPNPQVIVTIVHGFNTIESERSLSFAFHCVYTNYESAVCVCAHTCVCLCVCVCVRACVYICVQERVKGREQQCFVVLWVHASQMELIVSVCGML